jgi:hypothetical protein
VAAVPEGAKTAYGMTITQAGIHGADAGEIAKLVGKE